MSDAQRDMEGPGIFETKEDTYVIALWFIPVPKHNMDILTTAMQATKGAETKIITRFRYHVDDKVWGSKDKKSVYHASSNDSEEVTLRKMRAVQAQMALAGETEYHEVLVQGNSEKLIEMLKKQPWAHMKFVGKDN
jgi:hypothetical protein